MTIRVLAFAVLAAAVLPVGHAQEKGRPAGSEVGPGSQTQGGRTAESVHGSAGPGHKAGFRLAPGRGRWLGGRPRSGGGYRPRHWAGGHGRGAARGRAVQEGRPGGGPVRPDALAALEGLAKAGQAVETQRLTVTALDGGPVTVKAGASRPIVTSTDRRWGPGNRPAVRPVPGHRDIGRVHRPRRGRRVGDGRVVGRGVGNPRPGRGARGGPGGGHHWGVVFRGSPVLGPAAVPRRQAGRRPRGPNRRPGRPVGGYGRRDRAGHKRQVGRRPRAGTEEAPVATGQQRPTKPRTWPASSAATSAADQVLW